MRWGLYVVVFAVTAALRYLMLGDGFPNDHFVYITSGWQMLFGEWPTRDWVDPGLPLMFLASAAAQTVFGPTLLAEALLVSVAFGLAAALTTAAVLELTGSLGVAVVATLLEVAVLPRTYGYPKVLVYALAFLCFFRYVNRPGASRLVAMAVSIAVAFLFRHDHGLFLGIGGALTVLLTPDGRAVRARFGLATALGALSLLLVLPYLLYVQVNGGLVTYLQTGLEFSRREAARQWHVWPAVFGDALPWLSALVYELHVLPAAALIGLVALRRHPRAWVFAATVVPTAVVAVMVNYNFVRDPLMTRVPDAIVPAVVLGAWLFDRARDVRKARPFVLGCALVALGVFSASVQEAGSVWESFDRTDLRTEWDHLPRLFRERKETLQARMVESQVPTEATRRLRPFFQYLDRCTTQEHRLLVGGYLVEVPFFAQRRFAAGQQYFGGSFVGTEASERTALFRLREQVVPFVIMPSDYEADFDRYFPVMSGYVRSRYVPLTTVPVDDEIALHVLLDTGVPSTGRDEATGWPCFRPN